MFDSFVHVVVAVFSAVLILSVVTFFASVIVLAVWLFDADRLPRPLQLEDEARERYFIVPVGSLALASILGLCLYFLVP